MRILILGSGLMGPAAAFQALSDPAVAGVTLCDLHQAQLAEAVRRLPQLGENDRFATAELDITDQAAALGLMVDHDVAISALPQPASAAAIRAALRARRPLVDLTRPPQDEVAGLAREVKMAGGLAIIGCGVDPGLTEIIGRYLAEQLDRIDTLHSKCGGIPEKPEPPLGYKIVFGGRELPLHETEALVLEKGKLCRVPRYSGMEAVHFEGIGEVEAFHESFMPWLLELPVFKSLREGSQKTLRWPGYAQKIGVLRDLGLLGREPVELNGARVVPRDFLNALLAPRVRMTRTERDLTLFRVEATGEKNGRPRRYRVVMADRYDKKLKMTSMARVTAFTAAIVARMAARGDIRAAGLLPPEQVVAGALFDRLLAELAKHGIRFELTTERVDPLK